MNKTLPILVILIVAAAAVGFFVMRNKPADTMNSPVTAQETPAMQGGSEAGGATGAMEDKTDKMSDETSETPGAATAAKSFTLEGSMFKFAPNTITVKKGDTVSVTLKSVGGMHDFVVDEFNARTKRVNTGESDTVTFVADKAGKFEFYCSVANHRAMGMVGTLTVTE